MIDKINVIIAFKQSCISLDPNKIIKRITSVSSQFQRNVWEIDNDSLGLIRIEDIGVECSITLFPFIDNIFHLKGKTIFKISKEEFEDLKKLYFGDFRENECYLKKINDSIKK
jgi:hypothetical protein